MEGGFGMEEEEEEKGVESEEEEDERESAPWSSCSSSSSSAIPCKPFIFAWPYMPLPPCRRTIGRMAYHILVVPPPPSVGHMRITGRPDL